MTAEDLREIFSREGTITDVLLKFNKHDTSKGFAFVGFQKSDQAERAVRVLNNSLIGDQRIVVELSKSVNSVFFNRGRRREEKSKEELNDESVWGSVDKISEIESIKESEKETPLPERVKKLNYKLENAEQMVSQSRRIFLRNLSYDCKPSHIRVLMKHFGRLEELFMPLDEKTGKNRGYAFISFCHPINAVQAYRQLNGTIFQGRVLHLIPGLKRTMKENHGSSSQTLDSDSDSDLEIEKFRSSPTDSR